MKKFFNTSGMLYREMGLKDKLADMPEEEQLNFMTEISEDNINAHAAASAFYMFLSLVPFVALLTAIIPYTGLSQETLFDAIERYIPAALQAIIESVVDDIYFASGAVLPL